RNRSARRRLAQLRTSAPSPKFLGFRCVQNGSSARREEGAYLDRYVTDEQRSSRPIFNATLRAAASWLFFRVARSTVMTQIAALRSRLEKQPTDLRRNPRDLGDGALGLSKVKRSGSQGAKIARVFAVKTRRLGFVLSVCLFAICHLKAFAQSQYQSSTDFAKFAIKLRENGLLTFGST